MRLCSYVVRQDLGLAPNPFGGYCTLAVCTPNHMGVHLSRGDWLMGHAAADRGQGLIYAMQVSGTLAFDAYYYDPRFKGRKPRLDGTWQEQCGDNIYHRVGDTWVQDQNLFHGPDDVAKDTKHPVVFISEHFYYFGAEAPEIPDRVARLIWGRWGCKCSHPPPGPVARDHRRTCRPWECLRSSGCC
jgi:hypothetical protein